ncbi:Fc receptor-like protein 5 [Girardinichthys multiradiatus]|uniref:Fc receptor-like protein 5 n=1 Tax=Girardinichthys multiradiatus TaxID=208333 RepID=UPI001FAB612A|nr:Fc receptor-like protein 5 [Girardinichthys multiradiatus]
MRNALLYMLGFFSLITLLHGRADDQHGQERKADKPRATLTAGSTTIPVGGSVTLSCSVETSAGWKYRWFRRTSDISEVRIDNEENRDISVTQGGIYRCDGVRGNPDFYTEISYDETIEIKFSNKVFVTQQPNLPQIFSGETITLTCEVQGGETTEWTYEWRRSGTVLHGTNSKDWTFRVSESSSGDYMCQCRHRDDWYSSTQWSESITLSVSADKPRASMTAEETTIPAGGSVALSCSVDRSTGWKFDWFRQESKFHAAQPIRTNEPGGVLFISEEGVYSCRGRRGDPVFYTETSNKVSIQKTVSNRASVTLQHSWSQIFRGEIVTLRCEIQGGGGAQWTYEWRPNNRNSPSSSKYKIIIAASGRYSCRGTRNYLLTQWSDDFSLTVSEKPRASLTAEETIIPAGGSVALSCSVFRSTDWKFDWFRQESESSTAQPIRTNEPGGVLRVSEEGVYSCRGGRGDPVFYTETSNKVSIQKTEKLVPVLSVSPSWLSPGASVTLSCEVEPQSAGWRFFWYKAVPELSVRSYSFELLPNITNRTEQNSYIVHEQTHTAGYVCRAGRGEPVDYTGYSEPKFVWSEDPHPAASLSVSPDRVQHFSSDSVSLSCEGKSAEWRVWRFTETDPLSVCSIWGNMSRSTCTINPDWFHSGVYWCESGSGEFSNAVNITVQKHINGPILVSPVHPVTEGDPVTLSCRDKELKLLSNVFFYHNYKLLHNDSREELKISAVSKSDEGFYKCKHSGKESLQSWMSVRVTVSSPVSSLVMLIVGPFIGIILIILLVLLWRYRRSKDLFCIRSKVSESNSQSSTTNQTENREYSSFLQGDDHLYEKITSSEAAGNAADEPGDVTYALIEMKSFGKQRRHPGPEGGAVYSEVNLGAAGKRSPAAADAAVYSEIRSVPALRDNAAM